MKQETELANARLVAAVTTLLPVLSADWVLSGDPTRRQLYFTLYWALQDAQAARAIERIQADRAIHDRALLGVGGGK